MRISRVRAVGVAAALALLVFGAGAAVPSSASADDDNGGNADVNYCNPGTKSTAVENGFVVQTCTITASSGTCYQRSSAPLVRQECTFTQTTPSKEKRAIAIQIHDPEGFGDEQDGTQVIKVTQAATTRRNLLDAKQVADQCLGAGHRREDDDGDWNDEDRDGDLDDDGRCEDEDEEDGDDEEESEDHNGLPSLSDVIQSQEAHQSIDGTQTAVGSGKNVARAWQTQNLHQRAANAPAIFQFQNVDDRANECKPQLVFGVTNACYTIDQNAVKGANTSNLWQDYNLFQSARDTMGGRQEQGSANPFNGGLSHGFDQNNSGVAPNGTPIETSDQDEQKTQRRDNTGAMTWNQHGPIRKDVGIQNGDDNAKAHITQDSVLSSTGGGTGEQTDILEISCGSSGNCTGFQHAKTNDDEETNGPLTASFITMAIVCGDPQPPDSLVVLQDEECVPSSGVD